MIQKKKQISSFCKQHDNKCVQIGSCLTCGHSCVICQSKGCIKHHQQNQRIHNVHTVEYVRHIVHQYVNTSQSKKSYLKKLVSDYFTLAKKQLQKLYDTIYEAIDRFKFDTVILQQEQKRVAELLIEQKYSEIECGDIAKVLPKLIKSTNFQDGHFVHIRNYLRMQKQKLPNLINTMILNLPYFHQHDKQSTSMKFCQISDNTLKQVNKKLLALNYRPKKIRIRYSNLLIYHILVEVIIHQHLVRLKQSITGGFKQLLVYLNRGTFVSYRKKQFVRIVSTIENLNDIEAFQFYCVWDIDQDEYQIALFEALSNYPLLTSVTVFTGFKVTNTEFIQDIFENKNIQVRIYKKFWHF